MKIYLFDMNTKRYQKEGEAIYNPENPSNPHIPAYATKIAPPNCGACEAPYFINGKWEIRPCYYGKKAVHIESKIVETVYYEGDLKEGWQYVDDETASEIEAAPERFKAEDNKLVKLTDDEYSALIAQQEKDKQENEIKIHLQLLDAEAVRPLRAILAGTQTDEDLEKLKEIENQASELRVALATLQ